MTPAPQLATQVRTVSKAAGSQSGTSRPRVMFVIPGTGQGSSMIFSRRQAVACRQQGAEIEEFFLISRTSPVVLWRELRRFRREVARWRPQVIHAQFGTMTAFFAALGAGRIPLVITYRGSDLNPVPTSGWWRAAMGRLFSQLAALRATRIVCVSRQLQQRLWWRREIAEVHPTGVDAGEFQPGSREAARRKLGWPPDRKIVVFNAGRDPVNKRLDLAMDAIDCLEERLPGVEMKVARGDVAPQRMPDWLRAADCLLVTSDWEGSPTIVQEALAANLPIVSVPVGDVPERLAGVAGAAIAQRNPRDLARALQELLDPIRRSDGCTKSQEFSSIAIAGRLVEMFREIGEGAAAEYASGKEAPE